MAKILNLEKKEIKQCKNFKPRKKGDKTMAKILNLEKKEIKQ